MYRVERGREEIEKQRPNGAESRGEAKRSSYNCNCNQKWQIKLQTQCNNLKWRLIQMESGLRERQ